MNRSSQSKYHQTGFTLIEMLVVTLITSMLVVGVGVFLANGQQNMNRLYDRTYGDSAVDGFAVRKVFDSVCRKASLTHYNINDDQDSLEVYYWDTVSEAETPENYARLYLDDGAVYVQHGKMESGSWQVDSSSSTRTVKLAEGVETLKFGVEGMSIQMQLMYENSTGIPVVCSAVRHNQ